VPPGIARKISTRRSPSRLESRPGNGRPASALRRAASQAPLGGSGGDLLAYTSEELAKLSAGDTRFARVRREETRWIVGGDGDATPST